LPLICYVHSINFYYYRFQNCVQDMSCNSPFLTPECSPIRPEVVEVSTPWSDVLLQDLRLAVELDPRIPTRYGVVTGRSYRTRFRGQSKIVWLAILVLVGLLWALKGGKNKISIKSKLVTHQSLDGLQFINSSDPAIRVRQLAHLLAHS
jgi:hypothetical protein